MVALRKRLRIDNFIIKMAALSCLVLLPTTPVWAHDPYCEQYVTERAPIPPENNGFVTFDSNPFYNGGLLMELFGPKRNGVREWLRWVERENPGLPPENLPGIYIYSNNSFVVAKTIEYPIDAGLSQLGGDPKAKRIVPLLRFHAEDVKAMHGSSPAAQAAQRNLLRALDSHLFGIYGALREDSIPNLEIRAISGDHALYASRYPGVRYTVSRSPMYGGAIEAPSVLEDFKKVVEVVSVDEETVVAKMDLARQPENRNQEVIQRMIFITHWQMVQKAYRESGLFQDDFKSAIYLLDDFIESMESSQQQASIYLMYDAEAWRSMMFRMNLAHQYVAIFMNPYGMQPYRYQTIADVFYPFYPTCGMITEVHPNGEVELKRLFFNSNPDPLNMLGSPPPDPRTTRHFYRSVVRQIPVGTSLLAISKTPAHTRMYKGLGFTLVSSEYSQEWGTNKDTLRMTLDESLGRPRQ